MGRGFYNDSHRDRRSSHAGFVRYGSQSKRHGREHDAKVEPQEKASAFSGLCIWCVQYPCESIRIGRCVR